MVQKGVAVWLLGFLTFCAGMHVLDGFLWLTGNNSESLFLSFYQFAGSFEAADPLLYLVCSLGVMILFWGGTAMVAMRSPIEVFLGKVLEDGKKENQGEVELLEAKTSVLEMISETLTGNSELLAGLRDVVFNVRSEVMRFGSLNKSVEALKDDVSRLKCMMKRLENQVKKCKVCPACGRDVLAEFRLCPYCGENLLKPKDNGGVALLPVFSAYSSKRR